MRCRTCRRGIAARRHLESSPKQTAPRAPRPTLPPPTAASSSAGGPLPPSTRPGLRPTRSSRCAEPSGAGPCPAGTSARTCSLPPTAAAPEGCGASSSCSATAASPSRRRPGSDTGGPDAERRRAAGPARRADRRRPPRDRPRRVGRSAGHRDVEPPRRAGTELNAARTRSSQPRGRARTHRCDLEATRSHGVGGRVELSGELSGAWVRQQGGMDGANLEVTMCDT